MSAGEAAMRLDGPYQPLNSQWDRIVIETFASAAFEGVEVDEVRKFGGCGGNEPRAWVAGMAIMFAS